uniref:Uncharacterized protein n=1 Tax=Cannabis sativa TaxID=3483 RepID=A0A803PBY5_CANSA
MIRPMGSDGSSGPIESHGPTIDSFFSGFEREERGGQVQERGPGLRWWRCAVGGGDVLGGPGEGPGLRWCCDLLQPHLASTSRSNRPQREGRGKWRVGK